MICFISICVGTGLKRMSNKSGSDSTNGLLEECNREWVSNSTQNFVKFNLNYKSSNNLKDIKLGQPAPRYCIMYDDNRMGLLEQSIIQFLEFYSLPSKCRIVSKKSAMTDNTQIANENSRKESEAGFKKVNYVQFKIEPIKRINSNQRKVTE